MSLNAAVALLMVYRAQTRKEPIQTSELSQALMLSPSTTTRLMAYLGEGKEDVGFNGLGLVDLQIDKKDRRRRSVTMTKLGVKTLKAILDQVE